MLQKLSIIILLFVFSHTYGQSHPVAFSTAGEIAAVKAALQQPGLLKTSFNDIKKDIDKLLNTDIDVPFPKDPAGGYTHDRHKANYMVMFNSGLLYQLTGNANYASLTRKMLLKYAAMNPTLKNHPQATSSSPGHIFWQALNDANWMVYSGMAYDLVYNYLSPADRATIEQGAFKPEVDFLTKDLQNWFDLLHNHGVWACAGVGMIGLATNNQDYIDMALYGSKKDKKSGFIAQLDNLFSPDGYYTEGPYYTRYALLPFMVFANAINNKYPQLKIFEHRDRILQKALMTCLQQTNTDGVFFPINDALKDKDYTTNELVTGINIAWRVYGKNDGLLTIARRQNRVILSAGGAAISRALATQKVAPFFPYKTIESTDGVKGDEGGVTILRSGKGDDLTSLIFKYTAHGLSHGHFDKLTYTLFDKGNEVLQDYGSARFIGIEQKYGGRYLPENGAYAVQTIAHNTIVADETSHFDGKESKAEMYHAEKLFSDTGNAMVMAVAAKDEHAYKDIQLKRSLYLLNIPGHNKMIVDIFRAQSASAHQYDLPFQYGGQFIAASFKYQSNKTMLETMGTKSGYQFLWKEATANAVDTTVSFTYLNDKSYYSISSMIKDSARLYFTRAGANDPNFNLRREPSFIIRKQGTDQVFVNVLEIHGKYDAVNEFSSNAYPSVKKIVLLRNDEDYTVASVTVAGASLMIAQSNKDFSKNNKHTLTLGTINIEWTGPYTIVFEGKQIR